MHGRIKRSVHCRSIVSDVATRGDEMTDVDIPMSVTKKERLKNIYKQIRSCSNDGKQSTIVIANTEIANILKAEGYSVGYLGTRISGGTAISAYSVGW